MPGVLVDDLPANSTLASPTLPHSAPSLRHYIPVLTRSTLPDFGDDKSPPSQHSPLRCPPGVCLNVNSLPDLYADDGNLLEPGLLLQLSPASVAQWGCNGASPTTLSALSALRQFLPSNFEDDEGGIESQTDVYSCDEFRMYEFKVRRCMRGRSHDWTECPFAHPGEKARRRDPRRFHYSGTSCADFRKGGCKKGDVCEYAHGVFECWLHPARYRTQPCKDGRGCRRRICFFAHTLDQLRVVSPMAASPSALSSPTSLHKFSPAEAEAFEICASPTRSPATKTSSESFTSPLTSSPLCHMAMEAPSDGFCLSNFSAATSPPMSPSLSSRNAHINWSPRGASTFALPIPAMSHLYSSLHLNRTQASLPSMAAQYRHLEMLNQSLIPQVQISESKSALPSQTSATSCTTTMERIQELMGLLKQAELTKEEHEWRGGGPQQVSFCSEKAMLRQGVAVPTKIGYGRAREEEMLIGEYCNDDEEGEPKLERVESGKGLRAQIFESLLRSASQPSGCTFQDSNSEPLRSSSSIGMSRERG